MAITPHHRKDVLEARGIFDARVLDYVDGNDRPRYASYETFDDIRRLHTHPHSWHGLLAARSPGLVVNRWDVESNDLPSLLRHDLKLWTPASKHERQSQAYRKAHPSGTVLPFWHSHDYDRADGTRVVREQHFHSGHRYTYPAKGDLDGASSKVIDVHPLALQLLHDNPGAPICFCIEGCLKADAVLSTGRVAISVPSVTLWQLDEETLAPWLDHLRGAVMVYVIPDSDYLIKGRLPDGKPIWANKTVRQQTDACAKWLHDHGVQVAKLIPPFLPKDVPRAEHVSADDRLKQGVDDHLARGGNFNTWHKDVNPLGMHRVTWANRAQRLKPRSTKDKSVNQDTELLEYLMSIDPRSGVFKVADAAEELYGHKKLRPGSAEKTVQRGLKSLQAREVLRYWKGRRGRDPVTGEYYMEPHEYVFAIEHEQQTDGPPQKPRRPKPTQCPACRTRIGRKGRPHQPGSVRCQRLARGRSKSDAR